MIYKKNLLLLSLTLIGSGTTLKCMHTREQERTFFDGIRTKSIERVCQLARSYPTLVRAYDSRRMTPLHLAVTYKHIEIVRFLCEHFPAAVHLKNEHTETPLHTAAAMGDREAIALLIRAGARVDAPTAHGNTPLHKAACSNAIGGIDLLQAALSCTNQIMYNPIHIAVQLGYQATLQKLLKYADQAVVEAATSDNETPLVMAVIYGHLPCVYLLLKHGATTETPEGKPSLLKQALTHKQIHIARYLLDHGLAITTDATSILERRILAPHQTYREFLEKVHEQRLNAIQSCNQVPDDLSNLIATFVLSQIVREQEP